MADEKQRIRKAKQSHSKHETNEVKTQDSGLKTATRQNAGPVALEEFDNPESSRWDVRISSKLEYRVFYKGASLEPDAIKLRGVLESSTIYLLREEKEIELKGEDREKAMDQIKKKLSEPGIRLSDFVSYSTVRNVDFYAGEQTP